MMLQRSDFRTAGEPDFGLIELPYRGGSLSMIILLPDAADGLGGIESRMRDSTLADWLAQLEASTAEEVDLSLPRFTATSGFDLSQALGRMGMSSAFDSAQADFSGMTGARDVFISSVRHKAYVEVNEEGTVAAAATGSVMFSQAMRRPRVFRVDHPFLFLIRENSTGSILFLGRIVDPKVGRARCPASFQPAGLARPLDYDRSHRPGPFRALAQDFFDVARIGRELGPAAAGGGEIVPVLFE